VRIQAVRGVEGGGGGEGGVAGRGGGLVRVCVGGGVT
jgi:hypothetical protein